MLLYIEHCKNGNIHEIKKMNEQYNHNLKYFMGENKFVDGFNVLVKMDILILYHI